MATNPTLLTQPIAANGAKNVIPNTTSTAGAMSQDQGFPAETALPLGAGGVAPSREDFNGAFNLLSELLFYAQKGWQFEFDETQDYFAGCIVRDTLDNKLYEAINDVSASSTHPSADSVNWKLGTDMSAYTKTINAPMFNKRDIITTSGTYTAPVTGWYKITVKGGGGGGGGARKTSGGYYAGGGGGEGGTTIAYVHMTAGDNVTAVIGAGGTGGAGGAAVGSGNGTDGGDSSITHDGNTYTANGGKGGTNDRKAGTGGNGTISGCGGNCGPAAGDTGQIGGTGGGNGGGNSVFLAVGSNGTKGGGGCGGSAQDAGATAGSAGGNGYAWFEYFDSTLNP